MSLSFSSQTVESLFESGPKYWQEVNPHLHVCDKIFQTNGKKAIHRAWQSPSPLKKEWKERIDHDGYFVASPTEIGWIPLLDNGHSQEQKKKEEKEEEDGKKSNLIAALERGVRRLVQLGWPATFICIYDEAWLVGYQISEIMGHTSGGNKPVMDMLAWYIDPNRDQSGFSPHRDRQMDNPPSTFREDGSPKYTTCWLPLTDATTDNSCLFVIPRFQDPGYYDGDGDDEDADPMRVALPNKESYQHIKCLACSAGSAAIFTHRIIHWGSSGRKGYHTPRISLSIAFADASFEPCYLEKEKEERDFPLFESRLALMGGQMVVYHDRFQFNSAEVTLFYKLFMRHQPDFHKNYRVNVMKEYVASIQSQQSEFPKSDEEIVEKQAIQSNLCVNEKEKEGERKSEKYEGKEDGEDVSGEEEEENEEGDESAEDESDEEIEWGNAAEDFIDMAMDAMLDAEMLNPGTDFSDDFDEIEFVGEQKNDESKSINSKKEKGPEKESKKRHSSSESQNSNGKENKRRKVK